MANSFADSIRWGKSINILVESGAIAASSTSISVKIYLSMMVIELNTFILSWFRILSSLTKPLKLITEVACPPTFSWLAWSAIKDVKIDAIESDLTNILKNPWLFSF